MNQVCSKTVVNKGVLEAPGVCLWCPTGSAQSVKLGWTGALVGLKPTGTRVSQASPTAGSDEITLIRIA